MGSALDVFKRAVGGLRLDRYAGISASLLEGFSLHAALRTDGLTPRIWGRGAPCWAAKLGAERPGGPLRAAYSEKVMEARAILGRRILPLDTDLESWLHFLGACSADPSPHTLFARLGLRSADLSSLHALWAGRIERDEDLARQSASIAARRRASVPALRIVPAVLRPFPWSDATDAPPGPAKEPAEPEPASLPVGGSPPVLSVVTPSFLLPRSVSAAGELSRAPPLDPGTSEFVLPADTILPFADRGAPEPRTSGGPGPEWANPKPDTARDAASPKPGTATDAASPKPGTARDAANATSPPGETVAVFELPRGAILPFSRAGMTGTVEAFELRVKPPLPFSDASRDAAPDVAPPPAPSKEPQRKGQGIGETVVAFDLKALMASKPGRSPAQPATIPLTMEQHASLCAELALYTGREPEILARYGVTAEDRATLDRHYASIVSESPEQRARWYNAYRDYYQYLVTAARSR